MNEQQFGYRIKQTLNQGLPLDSATVNRLKTAREIALTHQRASAPSIAFARPHNGIAYFTGPFAPRLLFSGLILVLGLLVTNYWYQAQLIEENVEIDAAVLTGELPIDAYLDKGFDAWLKSSSE